MPKRQLVIWDGERLRLHTETSATIYIDVVAECTVADELVEGDGIEKKGSQRQSLRVYT